MCIFACSHIYIPTIMMTVQTVPFSSISTWPISWKSPDVKFKSAILFLHFTTAKLWNLFPNYGIFSQIMESFPKLWLILEILVFSKYCGCIFKCLLCMKCHVWFTTVPYTPLTECTNTFPAFAHLKPLIS